ncbi:hypothetical protein PVAP13_2KG340202 [Panicum virgatum]|uniref:Uncharacterized protein n=1 Tax=Panicum virgatum TaxID=38727 RepID=A0A8T0W7W9_PANVG|nr:hypothetical protein PVAP13_2KG340202 [Panicum virgatum]
MRPQSRRRNTLIPARLGIVDPRAVPARRCADGFRTTPTRTTASTSSRLKQLPISCSVPLPIPLAWTEIAFRGILLRGVSTMNWTALPAACYRIRRCPSAAGRVRPPAPAAVGCSSTFGARGEEAVARRCHTKYCTCGVAAGAVVEE